MKRLCIYISLLTTAYASVAFGAMEFIYPSPNAVVTSSGHFIFKLNSTELTSIRITHNGLAGDPVEVGSPEYRKLFQDMFIAQSLWDTGVNKLAVELFNGVQKIESAEMSVYYAPGNNSRKVPPEYLPILMHTEEKERLCLSCHNMNPTPGQMNSSVEKNNPCFICHKKMLAVKYVHGPAGTYSCGYCHASKGSPKHSVPKRGSDLCYECHSDMAVQIKKKKFIHGPVEAGMCESCHDSHGTQNESQLLMATNDLCLSCHEHISKQKHVVTVSGGQGHPLSGKDDPSKKASGRKMSCISCHNPHGSDVRYFFVNNAESRMNLCQMCHNK
ncbi:MAG: cytochrome c3 family protein [Desulfuromonadaceae bacterium]|nr:cytochrome c3 family protein [Desulfuromonadaceae bacterium]MDD2855985.1 cytochrome c3 family protein [Desulfuromonadaceae bacterium]